MAVITNYKFKESSNFVPVTLADNDTAVVSLSKITSLIVSNDTGADVTFNLTGDTATIHNCSGTGEIDLTGGLDFTVVDGETNVIPLNPKNQNWLGDGNITLTGTTGLTAYLLEI